MHTAEMGGGLGGGGIRGGEGGDGGGDGPGGGGEGGGMGKRGSKGGDEGGNGAPGGGVVGGGLYSTMVGMVSIASISTPKVAVAILALESATSRRVLSSAALVAIVAIDVSKFTRGISTAFSASCLSRACGCECVCEFASVATTPTCSIATCAVAATPVRYAVVL